MASSLAQRPQAEPTPWISVFGDDFLRVRFVLILEIPNEIWSTKTPTEIVKCWTWHFILHVQRCTQSYIYRHNAREAYLYQRASWVGFVSGRGFELACGQDVLYNSSDGSLHYPTVAGVGERHSIVRCGAEERETIWSMVVSVKERGSPRCSISIRHIRIMAHSCGSWPSVPVCN